MRQLGIRRCNTRQFRRNRPQAAIMAIFAKIIPSPSLVAIVRGLLRVSLRGKILIYIEKGPEDLIKPSGP